VTGNASIEPTTPIRVLVAGSNGRMGGVMMDGLGLLPDIEVVGGLTRTDAASPDRLLAGADVLVDFTDLESAPGLMLDAINAGVRPVSGTSGMSEEALSSIDEAAREKGIGAVWAASFSLGSALMQYFAQIAARYHDSVEIVEAHHVGKSDAPSGTALELTQVLQEAHGGVFGDPLVKRQTLPGTRGGVHGGVRVHSMRLRGIVGWHEVMFGGDDELLTLRHHTFGRGSFVPGVARTVREVMRPDLVGLIRGYDAVIGLAERLGTHPPREVQ